MHLMVGVMESWSELRSPPTARSTPVDEAMLTAVMLACLFIQVVVSLRFLDKMNVNLFEV